MIESVFVKLFDRQQQYFIGNERISEEELGDGKEFHRERLFNILEHFIPSN